MTRPFTLQPCVAQAAALSSEACKRTARLKLLHTGLNLLAYEPTSPADKAGAAKQYGRARARAVLRLPCLPGCCAAVLGPVTTLPHQQATTCTVPTSTVAFKALSRAP